MRLFENVVYKSKMGELVIIWKAGRHVRVVYLDSKVEGTMKKGTFKTLFKRAHISLEEAKFISAL